MPELEGAVVASVLLPSGPVPQATCLDEGLP